jgi:glycyl-tRNA synthetase beta chain
VQLEPLVETILKGNDWQGLTSSLAELSPVVTKFFDDVMVMDPDEKIRANRLGILKRCNALFKKTGDLGLLKL